MVTPECSIVVTMSQPLTVKFAMTNEDLLTLYDAKLDHDCKPALRYSLITIGFLMLFGPVLALVCHITRRFSAIDVIFVILGAILLRAWFVAPILRRRKISNEEGAAKIIKLMIDDNTFIEESGDTPKIVRDWQEINKIVESPKGFLIYFTDNKVSFLPTRAFENDIVREDFLNLAAKKSVLQ
jgi:hypothetical protein